MRWSESVTLEFVKIYLKHECLWNPAHTGYKLKYQREKAYGDITSEFKAATSKCLNIPEVKLKIKNLRTTYLQQVHKILQKSSPDSIYEPSLVWFHEMDRCLKHIPSNRHSNSYNNVQEIPEVDSSCQMWVDQELNNGNTEDSNPDPLISQTDDEYDSNRLEETVENIKKEMHTSPLPYKKIKKKKLKHRSKEYFSEAVENEIKEDEFDIYGKYIASQLRKMDLRNALKLKLEIHSLIILKINFQKSTTNMRWGEKETCQFVKLYLGHKLLWDPKLPAYKSNPERHKAYSQIIADFRATTGISLNEPEVKTKVKNLRSTYVQEIAKIRKRSGPDSVFKPSIKWFSAWHKCFSRTSRKSLSTDDNTFNIDETGDDSCQKIWVDQDDEVNEHDNSSSDPFVTEQDNFLLVLKPEPDESLIKQETLNSSYKMKKKKFKHSTSTDNSDRSYRDSIDPEPTAKEDEFDIYGKYIASQLRKMELQKALRLQLEIQSLVSEARISDMSGP